MVAALDRSFGECAKRVTEMTQIFSAIDRTKNEPVAIKVEPSRTDPRRMRLEQIVLVLLRGRVSSLVQHETNHTCRCVFRATSQRF